MEPASVMSSGRFNRVAIATIAAASMTVASLAFSGPVFAQPSGTPEVAKPEPYPTPRDL